MSSFFATAPFWPTRNTWSHWATDFLDIRLLLGANWIFFFLWSGGASLEERLSGLWGRFLAWPFSFCLYVSHDFTKTPRLAMQEKKRGFTKTWVGWLSCLRSPTFRCDTLWQIKKRRGWQGGLFFLSDGCMALCLHSPGGRPSVSAN